MFYRGPLVRLVRREVAPTNEVSVSIGAIMILFAIAFLLAGVVQRSERRPVAGLGVVGHFRWLHRE